MDAVTLLALKREHLKRLTNQKGAAGERAVLGANAHFIPRPTGKALANLLTVLAETGVRIKRTSFDAIALPEPMIVDYFDTEQLRKIVDLMTFIEIKTANQGRVRADFSGYFFAFTEGEIEAAEALGNRHKVMLNNNLTGETLLSSVPELLVRARSTTWQLSIQL